MSDIKWEDVLKGLLVKVLIADLKNAPDLALRLATCLEGATAPTAMRATMLLLIAQAQTGGYRQEQVMHALKMEWETALEIEEVVKREKQEKEQKGV